MAPDVLSELGSKRALLPVGVFVEALNSPTVKIEEKPPTKPDLVRELGQDVLVIDPDWRAPILDFIIPEGQRTRATRPSSRKLRRRRNRPLQALGFLRHPLQVHLPARPSAIPQ